MFSMHYLSDDTVSVLTHFLLDSALKGVALLVTTIFAALLLRRDSSATKHHVWLLGIVALLIAPVLAAALPKWQVLPQWSSVSTTVTAMQSPILTESASGAEESKQDLASRQTIKHAASTSRIPKAAGDSFEKSNRYGKEQSYLIATGQATNWLDAVLTVWSVGCGALLLRLLAAWFVLWREERRATVIWPRNQLASTSTEPLVNALLSATTQLGITRPIRLLLTKQDAIPIVWGVFHARVLLPSEAVNWPTEQLRSVLIHELAHVQRGDIASQLVAQLACALHWFNPLVWFAAWRLAAEREPACDDLVLKSGVRPSTYAAHLLEVTTGHTASPVTRPYSLAMARRSSLESRLLAILSNKRNRRATSAAIAAATLLISIGVVVPVAMLQADEMTGTAASTPPWQPAGMEAMGIDLPIGARVRWGEPMGGLRAAVVIKRAPMDPQTGSNWELYLAVENWTDAPIRLCDNREAKARRLLHIKLDGKVKSSLTSEDRGTQDIVVPPRAVTYLRFFESDQKANQGRLIGAAIADSFMANPKQSLVAELQIERAPEGAWRGRLVTGEATGSELLGGAAMMTATVH